MIKFLKASVLDDLKYNRYDDIAESALNMSKQLSTTDNDFFKEQLVLIVEQIIQKLVRTLPTGQVRLAMPGVQNMFHFMKALLTKDGLELPEQLSLQMSQLVVLFDADNKNILPNQILDATNQIRSPSADARLFHVMNNLPQGGILLSEAEANAKKRMSSESSLLELGEMTSQISKHETTPEFGVDEIVALWKKLIKMGGDLKDKPEGQNVADLQTRLHTLSKKCVLDHVRLELSAFIASQCVHGKNKMKCLDVPSWKVLALREFTPDDLIFRSTGWFWGNHVITFCVNLVQKIIVCLYSEIVKSHDSWLMTHDDTWLMTLTRFMIIQIYEHDFLSSFSWMDPGWQISGIMVSVRHVKILCAI